MYLGKTKERKIFYGVKHELCHGAFTLGAELHIKSSNGNGSFIFHQQTKFVARSSADKTKKTVKQRRFNKILRPFNPQKRTKRHREMKC